MRWKVMLPAAAALAASGSAVAGGNDWATRDEAQAMVRKAVAFVKSEGPEKAYAAFTKKSSMFIDRDIYIVVYDLDGKVLAHGANEKLVGKEMIDAQDVAGKFFVRERVDLAKTNATFWQDYRFVNPVTKKIEPKHMYCERLADTTVCAGVYKF